MIVTISGKAGSGKSTAAKLLAKRLGFRHYSIGDLMRKMALERGMTLAEFNRLGEKEDFTDKEVDEYQRELGKKEDNFVIDGRLSFHFIPHSFKIFITADLNTRTERVYKDESRHENLKGLEDAKKALVERNKSDLMRYQKYYGIDIEKEKYDLVIDNLNKPPERVVDEIIRFLEKKGLLKD